MARSATRNEIPPPTPSRHQETPTKTGEPGRRTTRPPGSRDEKGRQPRENTQRTQGAQANQRNPKRGTTERPTTERGGAKEERHQRRAERKRHRKRATAERDAKKNRTEPTPPRQENATTTENGANKPGEPKDARTTTNTSNTKNKKKHTKNTALAYRRAAKRNAPCPAGVPIGRACAPADQAAV